MIKSVWPLFPEMRPKESSPGELRRDKLLNTP